MKFQELADHMNDLLINHRFEVKIDTADTNAYGGGSLTRVSVWDKKECVYIYFNSIDEFFEKTPEELKELVRTHRYDNIKSNLKTLNFSDEEIESAIKRAENK